MDIPQGFEFVETGIHATIVRASDGAGLPELHEAGECPRDCPICNGLIDRLAWAVGGGW